MREDENHCHGGSTNVNLSCLDSGRDAVQGPMGQ